MSKSVNLFIWTLFNSWMTYDGFTSYFDLFLWKFKCSFLKRLNTLSFSDNIFELLGFFLKRKKMKIIYSRLNMMISLKVLFENFIEIFLINFIIILVSKDFLLFFESDFDRLLDLV